MGNSKKEDMPLMLDVFFLLFVSHGTSQIELLYRATTTSNEGWKFIKLLSMASHSWVHDGEKRKKYYDCCYNFMTIFGVSASFDSKIHILPPGYALSYGIDSDISFHC